MANKYRGMDGGLTFAASAVAQVRQWNVSSSLAVIDTTAMQDPWESKMGGVASWQGSATVELDLADAGQLALFQKLVAATPSKDPAACEFLINGTTKKLTGNAIVSSAQVTADKGDIVMLAITLTGSGALALAWA